MITERIVAAGSSLYCIDCGAQVLAGEPLHEMKVHANGQEWIDHRCRECIEHLSWGMWNEDWGPCPYANRYTAGHA
jgi:hypothetical protein